MQVLKIAGWRKTEVREAPLPKLRDDYVLVKVKNVALNPTDWKHVYNRKFARAGHTVGCDFYGIVEDIGPKVRKSWNKGDRVAGFVHGVNSVNPEDGCFGEYCVAKGDLCMRVPDNTSDEEAATLGVGISSIGQALYQTLKIPLPGSTPANIPVLIYGGSTATGTLAIQFAVRSGCDVITTCSPHNFDLVKRLGASHVFDYHDPDCGKQIRAATKDKLSKAFDCISDANSSQVCCDAVSSRGGEVCYLFSLRHDRSDVKNRNVLAYTTIGETFTFGDTTIPAKMDDFRFSEMFWELSTQLRASSQFMVHPIRLCDGGLQGIADGLKEMKEGKVSGEKLVYSIS